MTGLCFFSCGNDACKRMYHDGVLLREDKPNKMRLRDGPEMLPLFLSATTDAFKELFIPILFAGTSIQTQHLAWH